MPVKDADPRAVTLDAAFAEAMGQPGKPREPGPPPEVDNAAPFGRDDNGDPIAPHGLRKDGTPKLSAAGRKPAEEKARVSDTMTEPAKAAPATAAPGMFAPAIAETLESVWLGMTVVGTAGADLPVVGPMIPADKVQAQAAVVLTFKDNIAGALDLCAQHNAMARRLAEKMSGGQVGWALNAMMMMVPVVSTSMQVWGKQEPQLHPETGQPMPTLAETLAAQNRAALDDYMNRLAAQAQNVPQAA